MRAITFLESGMGVDSVSMMFICVPSRYVQCQRIRGCLVAVALVGSPCICGVDDISLPMKPTALVRCHLISSGTFVHRLVGSQRCMAKQVAGLFFG